MTEFVKAWQCIGCGKIEAPQPCIGVCQDRKVQFVYAADYEDALIQLREARQNANALQTLLRQLTHATPRPGEWEQCYRAFQIRARRVMAELATEDAIRAESAAKGAS